MGRLDIQVNHNNDSNGGGIGVLGIIQIVLIILKAFRVINIPWKFVLIPLWIEIALLFIGLCIVGFVFLTDRKGRFKW